MGTEDKDSKTPKFSGKKKDFEKWMVKFVARAKKKGYKLVLDGKAKVPDESGQMKVELKDKTTWDEDEKKNMILWGLNDQAYSDLINGIDDTTNEGEVALNVVTGSTLEKLKNSNAEMAWKNLKDKYGDTKMSDFFHLKIRSIWIV